MKLERKVTVQSSAEEARQRAAHYLLRAGYRQVGAEPDIFQRGSGVSSLVAFSPKGLGVKATLLAEPVGDENVEVTALFDVTTTGQILTKADMAFWDAELDGLVAAIDGTEPPNTLGTPSDQSAVLQNVIVFAVGMTGGSLLGAGGSLVMGQLFDWTWAGAVGGLAGLFLGLILGVWLSARWLPPMFK